jgi:hypothetical protein
VYSTRFIAIAAAAAIAIPLLGIHPASAQNKDAPKAAPAGPSQADLDKARDAYLKGAALIEEQKFQEAVDSFKESYRLSRNPLLLYNIGWTLHEMGDKEMALFYYEKFLADAPADAAQREFVSGEVKRLQREVQADAVFEGGGQAGDSATTKATTKATTETPAEPPAPAVTELQHKVADAAPPGKPLDLTAFVPDNASWQVTLFYRGPGELKYVSTGMRERYNELVGRIPATKMKGTAVQYYIEAKDKSGNVVDRSGQATSPHLVFIDETVAPRYYPDLVDERDYVKPTQPGGQPAPGGGFMDVESSRFRYAKWGTTGTAAGMLTLSVSFYLLAANSASSLEGEAASSVDGDTCPSGPPCRTFSDYQKDLEAAGQRYETLANVTLGVGVVAAGVAGYLWYREVKDQNEKTQAADASKNDGASRFTAVPLIDRDYVGAGAIFEF